MIYRFTAFLTACFVLMAVAWEVPAQAANTNFAVLSDPHFYDTALGDSGDAFDAYLTQDRKLLRESEAILKAALDDILLQNPEFVIIPGDLTKDGEKRNHEKLIGYLNQLESNGIAVYVAPGNHDINNPHAVSFNGPHETPVPTVSPDQFATLYAEFGYAEAISRDPASLSYLVEPVDGVWLFALDSCQYDTNLADGYPETGGAIKPATMAWLLMKLFEARSYGKMPIAFMHHGVLEHYTGQTLLFADYVVQGWESLSTILGLSGVSLVFTGHYHANDITAREWSTDTGTSRLYDVQTGSLVTFPSPWRMITLDIAAASAQVETFWVNSIDFDTGGIPFPEYALSFLSEGLLGIATYMLSLPADMGGFSFTLAEALAEAPFVAAGFVAHYAGDEQPDPETLGRLQDYLANPDPRYQALGLALGSVWTDLTPQDNTTTLALTPASVLTP